MVSTVLMIRAAVPTKAEESSHNSAQEITRNVAALKSRMRGRPGSTGGRGGRGKGGMRGARHAGSAPGSE